MSIEEHVAWVVLKVFFYEENDAKYASHVIKENSKINRLKVNVLG
jgi:hypothetical protein